MQHMMSMGDCRIAGSSGIADIGAESNVAYSVLFRRSFRVGKHSYVDDHGYFTANMDIGDYVHLAPMAYAIGPGTVRIEHFAGCAARVSFFTSSDNYMFGGLQHPAILQEHLEPSPFPIQGDIVIGRGCLLGLGTVVLPGVKLPHGVSTGIGTILRPNVRYKPWHYYDALGAEVERRVVDRSRKLCEQYGS